MSNINAFRYPNKIDMIDEYILQYNEIINATAKRCSRLYNSGYIEYKEYYPAKCKSVIDLFDTQLSVGYRFDETELDWIVNYDIKYRLGDN